MRKIEDITEIINKLRKKIEKNIDFSKKRKYFIKNNKILFTDETINTPIETICFKIIKNTNPKCLKCKKFSICVTIMNDTLFKERETTTNTMQCTKGEENGRYK